jgi:hypothetical protein
MGIKCGYIPLKDAELMFSHCGKSVHIAVESLSHSLNSIFEMTRTKSEEQNKEQHQLWKEIMGET